MNLLIILSFFVGFVVESITGFGGTLIAYSILLFFFDIKPLIIGTIILPILASTMILITGVKYIKYKLVFKSALISIFGLILGIFLFSYLNGNIILRTLALFLIIFGFKNLFFGEVYFTGLMSKVILFISGIIHGLIGTGGPIAVIGMKKYCENKMEIKSSMALYFVILNILRIFQIYFAENIEIKLFFENSWIFIPMFFGILIGNVIHKKISEKKFKTILNVFFILVGFMLLLRSFMI